MASVSHKLGGDRHIWLSLPRLEFAHAAHAARRIVLVILAIALCGLPAAVPVIGSSDVRAMTPALAILSFGFAWLPRREFPVYALAYTAMTLVRTGAAPGFHLLECAIQILEAAALGLMVPRYLTRRQMIAQPLRVVGYVLASLAITFLGATAAVGAATLCHFSAAEYHHELAGSAALAWRSWWLGQACSFVTISGTLTYLWQTSQADRDEIFANPRERRAYVAYALGHALVTLTVLPLWSVASVGIPADVRLALSFFPITTSMLLASRFRGFGTVIAILISTPIAIQSVAGPYAAANWAGLPPMITPVYFALMASTTMSWILAITLRRLQWVSDEALEASAVKSRFIAVMSHELRTPLNAILGFSELMRMQTLRELGEEVSAVDNIHASGQRLLAMIESVLDHADGHEAIFALDKQPVRLDDAVLATVADLNDQLRDHGCSMQVELANDLVVEADPRALKQILNVIVGYPLRFCGPGSVVSIAARHDGTDTVLDIRSDSAGRPAPDDSDIVEFQLVNALALAHGARLTFTTSGDFGRTARLRFFATRAA